jgi:hypothetical protein
MIERVNSSISGMTALQGRSKVTALEGDLDVNDVTQTDKLIENIVKLSSQGHQLSESQWRANQRENQMSHEELAAYAKKQLNIISADGYQFRKAAHDQERPESDEPERIERARLATEYVNATVAGPQYGESPFAGLSRDQLVLIAYDDSGNYTVNERRAAWIGSYDLEYQWRKRVVAFAQLESSQTGRIPHFLTEVLNHYKALPKIEQVQERYPENYVADMEEKIRAEWALSGSEEISPVKERLSLPEILAVALPAIENLLPRTSSKDPSAYRESVELQSLKGSPHE